MAKKTRSSRFIRRPLSKAEKLRRERQDLFDAVKLGHMQVVAFGHDALREAYRIWWHPYAGMGVDFDVLCGNGIYIPYGDGNKFIRAKPRTIVDGGCLMLQKLDPIRNKLHRARTLIAPPSKKAAPAKIRITVNAYVTETCVAESLNTKVFKIDRRYPGEVFGLLHDLYRSIYSEDVKRGGKDGPMNGGKSGILNRGSGPLIWGHDIGDLCIETVHYRTLKDDKDGAEGEFTFGIGS